MAGEVDEFSEIIKEIIGDGVGTGRYLQWESHIELKQTSRQTEEVGCVIDEVGTFGTDRQDENRMRKLEDKSDLDRNMAGINIEMVRWVGSDGRDGRGKQ